MCWVSVLSPVKRNKESFRGACNRPSHWNCRKKPSGCTPLQRRSLIGLLKNPLWVQWTVNGHILLTNVHSSTVDSNVDSDLSVHRLHFTSQMLNVWQKSIITVSLTEKKKKSCAGLSMYWRGFRRLELRYRWIWFERAQKFTRQQ